MLVGNLSVLDPDIGQYHSYYIYPEGILSVKGQHVVVSGNLNFEEASYMEFNVSIVDDGTPKLNVSLIILYFYLCFMCTV